MCYTVSVFASTHEIETALGATFSDAAAYEPYFHISGFVHPELPFVTGAQPGSIEMLKWGLVPRWVKNEEKARDLANKTLNARSETIFEKPSFRDAIVKRRGLLPVNGFVEWRHENDVKIPHLVRSATDEMLTLGCIWESWTNTETGEVWKTFSIVTTEANELMSYVHNNKLRMPVVIPPGDRTLWLEQEDRQVLSTLMRPLEEGLLEAFPLSRDVSRVKVNADHLELLEPIGETRT